LSVFTRIAIVFHVVLSLLLAAGLIVFVNRTENFRAASDADKAELSRAKAEVAAAKNDARDQQGFADSARLARDAAIADAQKQAATLQEQVGQAKASLADAQSNAKMVQVTQDNLTAALNASEAARTAQSTILDSTRKDNNDLTSKYSESQLAISDLTNKLEVAQRLLTNSTETVAEQKGELERLQAIAKDAHLDTGATASAGIEGGAPPIDAVVRSTRPINGIPYATISVGADAQVKAGMKFQVIDRDKGDFLGELTIEQVDEKEATGKLEGPRISEVHDGTEVKTQL
jgi:trimeric autotransporter adhesin